MHAVNCSSVVLTIAMTVLIGVSLSACADNERCTNVCARPFEMEEAYAKQRVQLLQAAPNPWPTRAKEEFERWQKSHRQALEAYLPKCLSECNPTGVRCQESAVNVAEWSACGH